MSADLTAEKQRIRVEMLAIRRAMSPERRAAADRSVAEQVTALEAYRQAVQVFAYVSMPHEVGTEAILKACLRDGKRLGLPVCRSRTHEMDFYRLDALSELKPGAYRIPVPPEIPDRLLRPDADTLVIVPMLAADSAGQRLGAGGGYYDRFFAAHSVRAVGICYADCLCEALPHDVFDRIIPCIITDQLTEDKHGKA